MVSKITNTIQSKYYTYVPGEFMPIMSGSELLNKREFHIYKARRAYWRLTNPKLTYRQLTHHAG